METRRQRHECRRSAFEDLCIHGDSYFLPSNQFLCIQHCQYKMSGTDGDRYFSRYLFVSLYHTCIDRKASKSLFWSSMAPQMLLLLHRRFDLSLQDGNMCNTTIQCDIDLFLAHNIFKDLNTLFSAYLGIAQTLKNHNSMTD